MRRLLIFLAFCAPAHGQHIIEGKIVDAETNKPIAFASINILGTSKGTSSNLNGAFTLSIATSVSLKITCIGYESVETNSSADLQSIRMKPVATVLNPVVVFNKAVDAKKIVRKAFAGISKNYVSGAFEQKFFYRHYCKDDAAYGRLIEAFVDVLKYDGYRSTKKTAGENEEIRVSQLRRSLDKTTLAQGHDPISIRNILQADIVGYQAPERSDHLSFYSEVSDLKIDIADYFFSFEGVTTYDGEEVYEIKYSYKRDSALTTSDKYLQWAQVDGMLFVTTGSHAIVKVEDTKKFGDNTIRTSAYYRKSENKYYPYQLIRDGENRLADNNRHEFHIDLMSVEMKTNILEKFTGHEPGKEELLKVPYDSVFWNNNSILKTTPLEDEIVHDLGDGLSLNKQFFLYRQYELNTHDGGKNGEEKFNWLWEFSKDRQNLYLLFWSGDCRPYVAEIEAAKQLQKKYRGKIAFIFISLDDNDEHWQQNVSKYSLYANGIINYRIGKNAPIMKSFRLNETPSFVFILKNGEMDLKAKRPTDPSLEEFFKMITK